MTANVSFVYAERDAALRIPNAALRFRPPAPLAPAEATPAQSGARAPSGAADRRQVWVADTSRLRAIPIRTGVTDGSFSELLEGQLAAGDRLVVGAAPDTRSPRVGGPGPTRLF